MLNGQMWGKDKNVHNKITSFTAFICLPENASHEFPTFQKGLSLILVLLI